MSPDDHQLTLADYFAILRRHAVLFAGSFLGILAVAAAVALLVPPVYQSTGTILIESQQIPTELVQATVTSYADERIEIIKQRVMTRENLLRIISKYKLFQSERANLTPSEQIDEMRKNTQVELVTANVTPGARSTGTIAFKVSFEHQRAEMAQAVANELVTLFLNENVKVRTERATQTTEFLKEETDRFRGELDKLEVQIATYKQQNGNTLPDNLALGLASMQRTESDLRQIERDHRSAEEELRSLEADRASAIAMIAQGQSPSGAVSGTGNLPAELQRARGELARLQAIYTESHPDVRSQKRRIENLEHAMAAERSATGASGEALKDPSITRLDARIVAARSRMAALSAQESTVRARMAQMEGRLRNAPEVERGLAALTRDYQSTQRKYTELRAKQDTAQLAENLEGEQKAERFALLEPPTVPEKPIKPDRKKLLAAGFAVAAGGSAALTALVETLHGTVRGVDAISGILGQRPLVSIPYIPVAADAHRRRRALWAGMAAIGAALVVLVVCIHFVYMPLDLLVAKLLMRFA
jgi:succinoglycan biosynthesis transport protein ExoP